MANTNSSGVGGQALRAAGETAAADAAATFVLSLAFGCDADPAEVGAIGWAVGIPGFLVFSTPQAVLALGAPPLDQLSAAGAASRGAGPRLRRDRPRTVRTGRQPVPSAAPSNDAGELPNTAVSGGTEPAWPVIVLVPAVAAALAVTRWRGRRAAP